LSGTGNSLVIPAEIQVSMLTTCEEGLGATGPSISHSQYVTADKPEPTAAFTTSREINHNLFTAS